MTEQQFDWYRLSLINDQKSEFEEFEKIIRSSNIAQTLDRVPTSYRKKLLTLFQSVSGRMKQEIRTMKSVNESLVYKKSALFDRIEHMEKGLEESKNELVRMKSAVAEKKKMSNKLKEKIENLKKSKPKETYFCPFCSRDDFSKETFTLHMFNEHQTKKNEENQPSIPNNSFFSSVNNELKDFILTLKDKEMEIMKMILNQKKEMETQDLERIYKREMNFMTMKNHSEPQYLTEKKYALSQGLGEEFYGDRELNIGNDEGEIRGESQFLFYQKSEKYQKAAEKEEYSLRKALEERKKELNRHPYYDIFKDLEENKSLNVDVNKLEEEDSDRKHVIFIRNEENPIDDTSRKETGLKFISNFNLKSNEEILESERKPPVQPLKMTSNNLQSQQFHPSITDRLKEEQKKAAYNSIYSDFGREKSITKGISFDEGYVFNSGPLVDDNGGYSDWEDYFGSDEGKKETKNIHNQESAVKKALIVNNHDSANDLTINFNISKETLNFPSNHPLNLPTQNSRQEESVIEDEEIKLNPGSYSFVSKSTYSKQHISQLLSPAKESNVHNTSQLQNDSHHKNKYSMYHNSVNEKSSIYDLSDSFSRRDLELSKDESSINLSDLRLSKLEKKRAEEKINEKNNPIVIEAINSPTYGKIINEEEGKNHNFSKKPLDFILVSEEKPFNFQEALNEPKINLLSEFERKIIQPSPPVPLMPSNYSFEKKQSYEFNEFYRQNPNEIGNSRSKSKEKVNEKGILNNNEFFKKENLSPNTKEIEESNSISEKALSPQEIFAQSMKKTSSNDTFKLNENEKTYVSQSERSEKIYHPPKIDFSEYERQPFGENRRESLLGRSQNYEEKYSSQRVSSSRERKKFRRHEDLENNKESILNNYFKNDFNESNNERENKLMERQDFNKVNGSFKNSVEKQSLSNSRKSVEKKSSYLEQFSSESQSYSKQSNNYKNSQMESYELTSGNGILDEFIR